MLRNGAAGVTSDSYKSLIATVMVAMTMEPPEMVFCDNSNAPTCFVQIISIGGYAAQCN